jgi:hypothetical protein
MAMEHLLEEMRPFRDYDSTRGIMVMVCGLALLVTRLQISPTAHMAWTTLFHTTIT